MVKMDKVSSSQSDGMFKRDTDYIKKKHTQNVCSYSRHMDWT